MATMIRHIVPPRVSPSLRMDQPGCIPSNPIRRTITVESTAPWWDRCLPSNRIARIASWVCPRISCPGSLASSTHPGPEAWWVLEGEQCLETTKATIRPRAGRGDGRRWRHNANGGDGNGPAARAGLDPSRRRSTWRGHSRYPAAPAELQIAPNALPNLMPRVVRRPLVTQAGGDRWWIPAPWPFGPCS